jgi:tRNA (adenine37-N6)-methyltransferase
MQLLSRQLEARRREERTGRIRAEVKLRTLSKEKTALALQIKAGSGEESSNQQAPQHALALKCIGTVVSPYTKRMGTPRQGLLVPSSRAFIELNLQTEALDGIESYSHVWIIFGFHANTNAFHKKTKVRPPRATGNHKVGQLATRSPHRPNPIGLSLVKMERLDKKQKRLHISALDLVNGTPVYDIKPCVPWDIPGYNVLIDASHSHTAASHLRVPDWVDQKDVIQTVQFTPRAEASLRDLLADGRLAPLRMMMPELLKRL